MPNLDPSLLVLDAHLSPLDILMTAVWVRRTYNPRLLLMPIAGYALYVPIMRSVVAYFASRYRITFMPVYRRVEYQPSNLLMRALCWFYPSSLTPAVRESHNTAYIARSIRALREKGSVVVVSPYGSPLLHGGKIKYGVRKMLELSPSTLITRSRLHLTRFAYKTAFVPYHSAETLETQFAQVA